MSRTKILSVNDQRRKAATRLMVSVGLESQLGILAKDILNGAAHLLAEFQQLVQYAPPKMKEKLLEMIDRAR